MSRAALALVSVAFALLSAAPSAAATVIGFDDLAAGTFVTNQYHGQGVDFFDARGAPFVQESVDMPPTSNHLNISHSLTPFGSDVIGTLVTPASSVSLLIGSLDGERGDVTLSVFDANGKLLRTTTVFHSPVGDPKAIHTLLSLTSTQFDIKSFSVDAPTDFGIDDVTFDVFSPSVAVQVGGPGAVAGAGGINCPAACVGTYAFGTMLALTATSSPGSMFVGWGGACSAFGLQPVCALTVVANLSASASFRPPTLTVALAGGGRGSVRSMPARIDCGTSCSAPFDGDAEVTLTAIPSAGSILSGWTGGCVSVGTSSTCTLKVHGDTSVSAIFGVDFKPPPPLEPLIDGSTGTPLPPKFSPPVRSLSVDVSGSGSVRSSLQRSGSQRAFATPAIACGSVAFVCFATAPPGARWTLRAVAAQGQYFKHWTGACSGTRPTCTSSLTTSETVGAVFAPRQRFRVIAAELDRPSIHVAWTRSVGDGKLVLSGQLAKPALVRIQLRRPLGAPLLSELVTIGAGRFRREMQLSSRLFAHGARLFPGGFIIVVSGTSGAYQLTRQLHTIVLAAPPRGVVRRAFASGSEGGKPATTVSASKREAWANFVFQTQPKRGQRIIVAWFWPDGRLLGKIAKPNRPTVTSSLGSTQPLPPGNWRAELRVGGAVVSALRVALR